MQILQEHLCQKYLKRANDISLFPWLEHKASIGDVYTPVYLQTFPTSANLRQRCHSVLISELFDDLTLMERDDKRIARKRVLLCGRPGTGKSTLSLKFAFDWANQRMDLESPVILSARKSSISLSRMFALKEGATELEYKNLLQKFDLVIMIPARDFCPDEDFVTTMKRTVLYDCPEDLPSEEIAEILRINAKRTLLILDGLNELSYDPFEVKVSDGKEDIAALLHGNYLKDILVLGTSRPKEAMLLFDFFENRIRILGFEKKQARECLLKWFENRKLSGKRQFFEKLDNDKMMLDIAKNPLNCFFLALIWEHCKQDKDGVRQWSIPITCRTSVFEMLFEALSEARCPCDERVQISGDNVLQWGKFAFNKLLYGLYCFTQEDAKKYGIKELDGCVATTWLKEEDHNLTGEQREYRFVHSTVEEFFAASYVAHALTNGGVKELCQLICIPYNPQSVRLIFEHMMISGSALLNRFVAGMIGDKCANEITKKLIISTDNPWLLNRYCAPHGVPLRIGNAEQSRVLVDEDYKVLSALLELISELDSSSMKGILSFDLNSNMLEGAGLLDFGGLNFSPVAWRGLLLLLKNDCVHLRWPQGVIGSVQLHVRFTELSVMKLETYLRLLELVPVPITTVDIRADNMRFFADGIEILHPAFKNTQTMKLHVKHGHMSSDKDELEKGAKYLWKLATIRFMEVYEIGDLGGIQLLELMPETVHMDKLTISLHRSKSIKAMYKAFTVVKTRDVSEIEIQGSCFPVSGTQYGWLNMFKENQFMKDSKARLVTFSNLKFANLDLFNNFIALCSPEKVRFDVCDIIALRDKTGVEKMLKDTFTLDRSKAVVTVFEWINCTTFSYKEPVPKEKKKKLRMKQCPIL